MTKPTTPNPKTSNSQTLNPQPSTLNPRPYTWDSGVVSGEAALWREPQEGQLYMVGKSSVSHAPHCQDPGKPQALDPCF